MKKLIELMKNYNAQNIRQDGKTTQKRAEDLVLKVFPRSKIIKKPFLIRDKLGFYCSNAIYSDKSSQNKNYNTQCIFCKFEDCIGNDCLDCVNKDCKYRITDKSDCKLEKKLVNL